MPRLGILWHLIGGHPLPEEEDGPAARTQIAVLALFASAVLAAFFGIALAGTDASYIPANLVRMPLVVLLASAAALPPALLAWRISGTERPSSDMTLGLASGTFTGTLVLAVLSPLVLLYGLTSAWLGPVLALGTAGVGVAVGLFTTIRAVSLRSAGSGAKAMLVMPPLAVMVVVHLLALTQLISIASLMPESTFLDGGLEGMAQQIGES